MRKIALLVFFVGVLGGCIVGLGRTMGIDAWQFTLGVGVALGAVLAYWVPMIARAEGINADRE